LHIAIFNPILHRQEFCLTTHPYLTPVTAWYFYPYLPQQGYCLTIHLHLAPAPKRLCFLSLFYIGAGSASPCTHISYLHKNIYPYLTQAEIISHPCPHISCLYTNFVLCCTLAWILPRCEPASRACAHELSLSLSHTGGDSSSLRTHVSYSHTTVIFIPM
jgi:hypothetical protein